MDDRSAWRPLRLDLGGWTVSALLDGWMRLDGGAMWGVVPATLWRKLTPPAEDNTIPLALRPFLLEGHGARVVVEPGIGDRWSEKETAIYHIDRRPGVEGCLAALGLATDDVTHVVGTHCHWDHFGAAVTASPAGPVPRFPRARYYAPEVEVRRALDPGHVRRASYRADDVRPVLEAGLLETYAGERELLPGVHVHVLGGHSDGVSVVTVRGSSATAVFWGDVVPTTHHIQPAYIMAYDIDHERSFEQRSRWLARAADEGWVGLFYHDADHAFGRLVRDGRRYACREVEGVEPATERGPR